MKSHIYPVLANIAQNPCALVVPWQGLQELGIGFILADSNQQLLSWEAMAKIIDKPTTAVNMGFTNLLKARSTLSFQELDEDVFSVRFTHLDTPIPSDSLSAHIFMLQFFEGFEVHLQQLGRDRWVMPKVAVPKRDLVLVGRDRAKLDAWSHKFYNTKPGRKVCASSIDVLAVRTEDRLSVRLHEHIPFRPDMAPLEPRRLHS